MDRRKAVQYMAGMGLGTLLSPWLAKGKAAERPNIIFMMSDDHANAALSCYGSRLMQTPNLDRIAKEGMKFNHCYVTNSLCAPSRATILTGKYSHENGIERNIYNGRPPFDGSQQTFPKLLQQVGYKTAMIGKWHLESYPTGFDYWNILPGQGRYNNPDFIEMGQRKTISGYVTDIITDITLDTIKNRFEGSEPFCIMMHHKAPHRGWVPDAKHSHLFDDYNLPFPETFYDDYLNRANPARDAKMRIQNMPDYSAPDGLTPKETQQWKYQQFIKDYLGTIASVDENTGRLLDYLDQSGLADRTIVIYTTDNGMFIGEHGWFDKRFMYEESIQVPFMVRYPKEIPAGSENNNIILNIDYAETFLDYAGAPIPSDMQGRSLRPLFQGQEASDWRQEFYYHYYEYGPPHWVRPQYGIRTHRYKLVYYYNDGDHDWLDEWELFDLTKDPHEMNSVYFDPDYAEIKVKLKNELVRLRNKYNDDTGKTLTSIQSEKDLPENFKLKQNYPNPFNPSTNINFELPGGDNVSLKVFNIQGKCVRTLVDKYLSAGKHSVKFNAGDLTSGMYFYQLSWGKHVLSRKLLLIK